MLLARELCELGRNRERPRGIYEGYYYPRGAFYVVYRLLTALRIACDRNANDHHYDYLR